MLGNAGKTEMDLRFQLFGIPIRVHPAFWLMGAFVCWRSAGGDPKLILIGIVGVFISVLIHELGHALMFRRYGHRGEIVLYMMGGYATGGLLSTWKRIAVSAAGPAAGFVVAAIIWGLEKAIPLQTLMLHYELAYGLHIMWFVNFWWGVLNLIPCLPLDGGHILESLIYRYWSRRSDVKVLWISIIASGTVALWAVHQQDRFLMILFGLMCAQHVVTLNQRNTYR